MNRQALLILLQCYVYRINGFHTISISPNLINSIRSRSGCIPKNTVKVQPLKSSKSKDSTGSSDGITDKVEKILKEEKINDTQISRPNRKAEAAKREGGAWYLREEMMQHDILTKEMENDLGRKVVLAKKLRDEMIDIIEEKKIQAEELRLSQSLWEDENDSLLLVPKEEELLLGSLGDDIDFMSVYDSSSSHANELWRESHADQKFKVDQRISSTLVQDGSKLSLSAIETDLEIMTDEEVRTLLKVPGGKNELRTILHVGAESRTTLMKSNIRLVVSISKKWMGRSFAAGNGEGTKTMNLYNGGWDRPSLDEVIQEGVLGLARAVDKFDPDRGLRFSTYSTHWITSYVRQSFQDASTGCLKVPAQLHEIKNAYKSLVKQYVESSEAIPSEDAIAAEMGVTVNRLRTALRATESLISIDEPVFNGGNAAYKGSGAGGDNAGGSSLLLLDRLQCSEIAPEDFVEISFLRQTLENAMAAELSPHERDIVRLRLGLDDGQTRTVRQVVEACGGGITVSDVRSTERRALKKLRSPSVMHAHNLIAYLEMIGMSSDYYKR